MSTVSKVFCVHRTMESSDSNKADAYIRELLPGEPPPNDLLLLADELEMISTYLPRCRLFLYVTNGTVVGEYALERLSGTAIEIRNIAVAPDYQGQGIGQALLKDAISRGRQEGYREIWIGTGDVMFMQLRLYQKVGFEMHSVKHNFYLQPGYPQPLLENGLRLRHMVMLRMLLG